MRTSRILTPRERWLMWHARYHGTQADRNMGNILTAETAERLAKLCAKHAPPTETEAHAEICC